MKSKIIIGIVAAVAVLGGGYTVSRMDFIGTGKVGIVYNYKDGVQDTVLTTGMHFIAPMNKVKEFSTSNEILVLTKDKRDGSKEDDSFKVATSDDASITVSFQMSYRYDPDTVIRVYPAHCFEINISINFCMVISSCISDIFSKKPLTILCRNDMSKCCSSGRLLLLYQFQQLSIQHPVRMECRCRMPTEV